MLHCTVLGITNAYWPYYALHQGTGLAVSMQQSRCTGFYNPEWIIDSLLMLGNIISSLQVGGTMWTFLFRKLFTISQLDGSGIFNLHGDWWVVEGFNAYWESWDIEVWNLGLNAVNQIQHACPIMEEWRYFQMWHATQEGIILSLRELEVVPYD